MRFLGSDQRRCAAEQTQGGKSKRAVSNNRGQPNSTSGAKGSQASLQSFFSRVQEGVKTRSRGLSLDEIDPSVLAELPADIQAEFRSKKVLRTS